MDMDTRILYKMLLPKQRFFSGVFSTTKTNSCKKAYHPKFFIQLQLGSACSTIVSHQRSNKNAHRLCSFLPVRCLFQLGFHCDFVRDAVRKCISWDPLSPAWPSTTLKKLIIRTLVIWEIWDCWLISNKYSFNIQSFCTLNYYAL